VVIDIEPRGIERVTQCLGAAGLTNVTTRTADVFDLLFKSIYLIAGIGEKPSPERAMAEFHRVLRSGGTLAFSELLADPDYPRPRTLWRWTASAGFQLREKLGNLFYYTLICVKPTEAQDE
jgi:ubiquinone/menaquinone biosynthesis C-methylase UbiE